jgi:hypothetical protein
MEKDKELLYRLNMLCFEKSELETDIKFHRDYNESIKDKPTRLEVIDKTGRVYTNNNCTFELDYQDSGRTLKIFIK